MVVVETMPIYEGGDQKLLEYVGQNVVYPPVAKTLGITGVTYVGYVVNTDGEIDRVHVAQGSHPILDAEAVRVVKSISGYTPGTQNGKPVAVRFTLPVRFTLAMTNDAPQRYFEKAMEEFKAGNRAKGDNLLDRAISLGSTWYIEAYVKRAEFALSRNEYDKAQSDYEKALTIDSLRADLWIGKGKCLYGRKMVSEAMASLKHASQLNPYSARAHALMGMVSLGTGQFQDAELHYGNAIQLNGGDHELYYSRGMAYARLSRMTEACEDWNKARKLGNKTVINLLDANCK